MTNIIGKRIMQVNKLLIANSNTTSNFNTLGQKYKKEQPMMIYNKL